MAPRHTVVLLFQNIRVNGREAEDLVLSLVGFNSERSWIEVILRSATDLRTMHRVSIYTANGTAHASDEDREVSMKLTLGFLCRLVLRVGMQESSALYLIRTSSTQTAGVSPRLTSRCES